TFCARNSSGIIRTRGAFSDFTTATALPEVQHRSDSALTAAETPAPQGGTGDALHGDARIDDVIESLSQALGAAIHQQPDPAAENKDGKSDDPASMFERWTVRPRRTQQQT
ncbi:hypothetical protein OMR07_19480, partial [Methylobacterium organophilum]|nr:hypothetical protein [Methylobacterium organophilum]